jgi:SagB-type dehydrogenase family enzyme
MPQSYFLTLRDGLSFEHLIDFIRSVLPEPSDEVSDAIRKLMNQGEYADRLENQIRAKHGDKAVGPLREMLQLLDVQGLLSRSVYLDSKPFATQVPLSFHFSFQDKTISKEKKYALSRFAYVRKKDDRLVLECPLSYSRVILKHSFASAVLDACAQSVLVNQVCKKIPGLPNETATDFMSLLLSSNMLCEINEEGHSHEEEALDLQCWEFHDLLFHSRSRAGRHDTPAGGTYRFAGRFHPPPVLKVAKKEELLELYTPDLGKIQKEDPPYARVQEERCSIREYSEKPISDQQLGEFLYRVGRVADYIKIPTPMKDLSIQMDVAPRPYPAAGSIYELELYPLVNRCENIESGLYYYEPDQHGLIRISGPTDLVGQLLQNAGGATMIPVEQIQVLIIIAARFQRISWKYSALAYSLILKNVGVLYQTMYLAATAMGLAPCAIGYGDSDIFSEAAGTEYYTETSVGEFLLGSKP